MICDVDVDVDVVGSIDTLCERDDVRVTCTSPSTDAGLSGKNRCAYACVDVSCDRRRVVCMGDGVNNACESLRVSVCNGCDVMR